MIETNHLREGIASVLERPATQQNLLGIAGRFHLECRNRNGNLKWTEDFGNAVVEAGKKYLLDAMNSHR